jgi:hypothetical protein
MDAKICDKCGVMWKDTKECDVFIRKIIVYKDTVTTSSHLGDYDLCGECYNELFKYLHEGKAE